MLQDSIKEKDPMKVGRFGLGFKSVLHVTGKWRADGGHLQFTKNTSVIFFLYIFIYLQCY